MYTLKYLHFNINTFILTLNILHLRVYNYLFIVTKNRINLNKSIFKVDY